MYKRQGLNANSVAGDTITLTIYGIGDNIGQETTFEVDYAATIETGSTLFNGDGIDGAVVPRDSDVGSIPFVEFSFVSDGVTDSISFDATEGGILNGFSVGITAIPEPSSAILLAGFGLLGLRRRK